MVTQPDDTIDIMHAAIPIVAVSLGGLIFIVGIVIGGVRRMVVERAREASRRDIAAYVAEGSLTPDDAVKLIEAGTKRNCWSGPGVVIGASVARDKKT